MTDEELYQTLTETGRLLRGVEPVEGEEYSLDAILAEYGQDASPGAPAPEREPEPAPAPEREPEPARQAPPAGIDSEDLRASVAQTMEQMLDGGEEKPRLTLVQREKRAPEPEPDRRSEIFPEEPEGKRTVPLEQVMSETVEAVLDEDDAILEPPLPLGERVRDWLALVGERLSRRAPRRRDDTESLWEQPESQPDQREEPEPDPADAAREAKRLCARLYRHTILTGLGAAALAVLTVLEAAGALRGLWGDLPLLRVLLPGGVLALTALAATPVWRTLAADLRAGRMGCELAAALMALVSLGDCAYLLANGGGRTPLCVGAAIFLFLCQWGALLSADVRRESFRLTDMGGAPPYGVSVTAAGCCKQRGTLTGFYRLSDKPDPARRWQTFLVPLYAAATAILSGVVCLSRGESGSLLHVWSVMLAVAIPFALPLASPLPLHYLTRRLAKSGSAVAGYTGARTVSRSRRMVVTDDDLFPPGTVGLNGLKVFGEEIGKVVSYAASVTAAARSQLQPLFEQLLTAEGGRRLPVEDLQFYEEGGVGGTIRGESVTMGSAYFMRKTRVTLPQELKLKTGVFLAVDGVLIAIFAIKYQPSRNVEWALRALRRNRIEPVMATRSCNVTPGLLRRKFSMNAKPVYPAVSTRLALGDVSAETAPLAGAAIYREGLMPYAEVVVGSRRMVRSVRLAGVLAYLGGLCGLLLAYYFTSIGAAELLDPLRLLGYQALWLLPVWLLGGMVKHY